jgi:hypothetical protein
MIDVLAFLINAQNACLFIRREGDDFLFENFEVSCRNADVIAHGRLQRVFPSKAIKMPSKYINDSTFRKPFAQMLAKLDGFTPSDAFEIVRKAKDDIAEIRHSINPRYVTEMVFGMLRGLGTPVNSPTIHKYVREDILWSSAFIPWRRSPLWTVLRVAIQTTLMRYNESEKGRRAYKAFMIYFMARMLDHAAKAKLSSDMLCCMQTKVIRRLQKFISDHEGIDNTGISSFSLA